MADALEASEVLRSDVRRYLEEARDAGLYEPASDSWLTSFDADFSAALARRGWVGMTIPSEFGGPGRSAADRFVVAEELVAAGAPVAAHWIADRQVAPNLLRYGTHEQQERFLPPIAEGRCFFAIGMSEPDAGSDLAAVRSRAISVDGGYSVTGTKVWSSNAHLAHWMIALVRTSRVPEGETRHAGLSQLLVNLREDDVDVRPIRGMDGNSHFCEVVFDETFLPADRLLGTEGEGWRQVTSELAIERSGPERYLSTVPLLRRWVAEDWHPAGQEELGVTTARLWALRELSTAVASGLDAGDARASFEAIVVKSHGAALERDVIDVVRRHGEAEADPSGEGLPRHLAHVQLASPGFSLRGGTTEILRTLIAREWLS